MRVETSSDLLLLRLRAPAVVGTTGLVAELARHLELHRRQLAEYFEIERQSFADASGSEAVLQHLVLRAGIQLETFWAEWLDEAVATVRGLPDATDTR